MYTHYNAADNSPPTYLCSAAVFHRNVLSPLDFTVKTNLCTLTTLCALIDHLLSLCMYVVTSSHLYGYRKNSQLCFYSSLLLSQSLFLSLHPFTFSPNSNFSGFKSHVSHLFCWLFLPHLSLHLPPPSLLLSLPSAPSSPCCIHLHVLSNPLTSPAHCPTYSSLTLKTLLVTLYFKGCA